MGVVEKHSRGDESRGPRRSRSSALLLAVVHIVSSSLPLLPRVFFVPVSRPASLPRVSSRLYLSFSLSLLLHPPSQSLAIVPSSARGVFRGKRPGLVDGPSHGLQLSPSPSRLSDTPYPPRVSYLPSLSLIFGTESPFFFVALSTPRVLASRRAPSRVFSSPPYISYEEESRKRAKEEDRRTKRDGDSQRGTTIPRPMY